VRVGLATNGDACVESSSTSTGSVGIHELFGDGIFEIMPGERWLFSNGAVSGAKRDPLMDCGCPVPVQQQRTVASEIGFPEQQSRQAADAIASGKPVPEAPPIAGIPRNSAPDAVHMQVDAPMVFRAEDAGPLMPVLVARATLRPASFPQVPAPQVSPPPAPKPAKKNWFQRFGSTIARLFGARNS
jgi:hypothetical protein